jgi:hypothetical protein
MFNRIYIVYYELIILKLVQFPTRRPRVARSARLRNALIFVDRRHNVPRQRDDPIYTKHFPWTAIRNNFSDKINSPLVCVNFTFTYKSGYPEQRSNFSIVTYIGVRKVD